MKLQVWNKMHKSVQTFLQGNPEYLERIEPVLDNPIQIPQDHVPDSIYFIFDEIVCGVMTKNRAAIVDEPPNEDPFTFEVQFDDEPVFLTVGKHVVINRINNLAELQSAFAAA